MAGPELTAVPNILFFANSSSTWILLSRFPPASLKSLCLKINSFDSETDNGFKLSPSANVSMVRRAGA